MPLLMPLSPRLQILLLDAGEAAEFGTPDALLADPTSRFARLAATQGIYHPPNLAAVEPIPATATNQEQELDERP